MTSSRPVTSGVVVTTVCIGMLVLSFPTGAGAQTLLGYWKLDEQNTGDTVIDSSGNGLDGMHENGVIAGVQGAPGFGLGADFDGTDDQILIGPGFETGFGNLVADFTVMAWINPDNFDSKNRVFGGAPTGGAWGWGTADDNLQITTYGVRDFTQAVPLQANEWTHAAVALDAANAAHFYAGGEFLGTQTHDAAGNPIDNIFYIGYSCCVAEHFDGQLDEVAVFSGVLTEEQIQNAMTFGVEFWEAPPGFVEGDFDGNEVVNEADFEILSDNLAAHLDRAVMYEDGDINRDGRIALDDFGEFKALYPGGLASAPAIPEPTTLVLAGLMLTIMCVSGRQGRSTRGC